METIKGRLKKVSKYKGIMLDGNDKWYNPDNNIKADIYTEALKELIGHDVELELSDKGYYLEVTQIEQETNFKAATELKNYLLVKAIFNRDIYEFENEFNRFAKQNKVKFSQTHVTDKGYSGFLYYEVQE
jgi:hypothetical protein